MARTGTELVGNSLSWLGDRAEGYIGGQTPTNAALSALNDVLHDLGSDPDVPELEKSYEVSATSSAFRYALPEAANSVRIKKLLGVRALRSGEVYDYPLTQMPKMYTFARAATPVSDSQGSPVFFRIFARNMEIFPWPDDDYTVTIYCYIWPTEYTVGTLGNEQPFGREWDRVIEYLLTAQLYYKLQQFEEGAIWESRYEKAKARTQAASVGNNMKLDGTLRDSHTLPEQPVDDSTVTETYLDLATGQWVAR